MALSAAETPRLAIRKPISKSVIAVILLTLAGLFIRYWHLGHGLPAFFYSDEGMYTYYALNMGSGDLNPHRFQHPSLYFYICFFADVIFILWNLLTGVFKTLQDAWVLYRTNPTAYYLVGRIMTATFGALTIPLTYRIGEKIFSRQTGLLAAFFLTFSFCMSNFRRSEIWMCR